MGGRNSSNWSAYDFEPVTLDYRARKRLKSEAPLSQQVQNASPSNSNHRQRLRALEGLPPYAEGDESERRISPLPPPRNPQRDGITPRLDDHQAFSRANNRMQGFSQVPGIIDILDSFKPPDSPRVFKEEPVDESIMRLPLRRITPMRRRKNDEPSSVGATAHDGGVTTATTRQRKKINEHRRVNGRKSPGQHTEERQHDVVDLTEEVDSEAQLDNTGAYKSLQRPGAPTWIPVTLRLDSDDYVPDAALQHIKQQYQKDELILPTDVRSWSQLEEFASRNRKSRISPSFISQLRISYSTAALKSQANTPTQHNTSSDHTFLNPEFVPGTTNIDSRYPRQDSTFPYLDRRPKLIETRLDPVIKLESEEQRPTRSNNLSTKHTRTSSDIAQHFSTQESTNNDIQDFIPFPNLDPTVINFLMSPSDVLVDILPPSAPLGHPHLVPVWDAALLYNTPTTQHDHLNIVDTVVSIIAKYDMKEQSAIKAFFDMKAVAHFFFLFKSRTSRWHSWSIEREWDVVTIGLERNSRAPNTSESERPSSGQFDITIQYKMDSIAPVITVLPGTIQSAITTDGDDDNTATSNPAPHSDANPSVVNPSTQAQSPPNSIDDSPRSVPTTAAELDSRNPTRSKEPSPFVPGRWTLHATTIFPLSPPLETFLWSTPPNRGADEISYYHHPAQTSILPNSHLSMLARYLQQTAFTTTAIEAEFQVAWGRRVRYDAQLGRIRPTWDYALKGARTQAEKRRRGEYNRIPVSNPPSTGSKPASVAKSRNVAYTSTNNVAREERPGAGESMDWLAGRNRTGEIEETSIESQPEPVAKGRSGGRDSLRRGANHSVNGIGGARSVIVDKVIAGPDVNGPLSKRPKRESGRKQHADSGSEHEASSDED